MTVVVIVVYSRFENLRRWLECWQVCEKSDAEMRVIHNCDSEIDRAKYAKLCAEYQVTYIPRKNIGMDIGAFQDVCRGRLHGFSNNWEFLIWNTDDIWPMDKNFIKLMTEKLNIYGIGLTCIEISNQIRTHVRTNGFCIKKETASMLKFSVDPIRTKDHCYDFEHRGNNTLLEQVQRMGLAALQIGPLEKSCLWDIMRPNRLNRFNEHYSIFPRQNQPKIFVICPAHQRYPQIISSLICQTYKDWQLLLIHDGQDELFRSYVRQYNDKRIIFEETPAAGGKYGHPIRQRVLNDIRSGKYAADCEYILITNEDNYHIPTYFEYMIEPLEMDKNLVASYCSDMVHSYKPSGGNNKWGVIPCSMQLGYIDCASVIVRKSVAVEIGWRDINGHSSDWTYFSDIIKKYGANRWAKVPGCLFVHN